MKKRKAYKKEEGDCNKEEIEKEEEEFGAF
jgi:hypothetical protein